MMVVGMLKVQNAILYFLRAKAFCSFSYFIHLKGGDGTKKGSFITKMVLYTSATATSTTMSSYEKSFSFKDLWQKVLLRSRFT